MYRFIDHGGHLYLSLSIQPFPVELLKKRIRACVITGEGYNMSSPVLQLLELIRETFVTMPPDHAAVIKIRLH